MTEEELLAFCKEHVHERAAQPKSITIMGELPKTAVGKIFKPDLRRMAITRVFDSALEAAGVAARVDKVVDDKKRGLIAHISMNGADAAAVGAVLGDFITQWDAAA